MKRLAFVVCMLACAAQAQKGTFTTYTTTWNSLTRTYSVYVPPVLQPNPAMVMALHGADIVAQSSPPLTVCTANMGWDAIADANGFVLVCPISSYVSGGTNGGRFFWDSYGMDTYFPAPPDDSGLLRSLILLMQQPATSGGFGVDPTRTFVMGFSSGGMMTHRVCIENADVLAACAPVSGPLYVGSPAPTLGSPSRTVSIIELHGDTDPTLDYCGGPFSPVDGVTITVPSVDVDVNYWLAANGLTANSTPLCSAGAPSASVFKLDSKSASGQTEAQFVRELGYDHTYEPWTIASTWEFFSTHARSGFTMSANPPTVTVPSPGRSGSTTLTFTAQNGLTGSATLSPSACSNLPAESACSFSPSSVSFTSSVTTVPVTLTITTTGSSARSSLAIWLPGAPGSPRFPVGGVIVAGLSLFGARFNARRNAGRERRWRVIPAWLGLVMIASALACGGGSGAGGGGNPGTPAGNYAGVKVAVTINGITQSISNLNVNVQ